MTGQSHVLTLPIMRHPPTQREAGFSLLEVLISILVLCFGILGLVGLQAASLQANREARLHATAVRLAEELAEMMRGNKETGRTLTGNPYMVSLSKSDSLPADPSCGLPGKPVCGGGIAIAQRDIREWMLRIRDDLPDARVVICEDNAPYDGSGLPHWTCSNSGGTVVLKIGWTRSNTLRSATGTDATDTSSSNLGAFDKALRPAVTFPLTPGVTAL